MVSEAVCLPCLTATMHVAGEAVRLPCLTSGLSTSAAKCEMLPRNHKFFISRVSASDNVSGNTAMQAVVCHPLAAPTTGSSSRGAGPLPAGIKDKENINDMLGIPGVNCKLLIFFYANLTIFRDQFQICCGAATTSER
jgi:hypothetical protein